MKVHVSFEIGKNHHLLCYSSGGGKSTVLSMILRLYDPISGDVKLDGNNLKEWVYSVYLHSINF